MIVRVDRDSPADRAGLEVGDVVVRINDRSFKVVDGAYELIHEALGNGQPLAIRTAAGDVKTIEAIEVPDRSRPVHPTQIYSSITAALLAWMLWSYYPLRRRDGEVTALMITLYPIARYLEEVIRVDEPSMFGTGLSISQNVSVLLLLAAGGMWIWLRRQPAGRLAFSEIAAKKA